MAHSGVSIEPRIMNPESWVILPNSLRPFIGSLQIWPFLNLVVNISVTFILKGFRFGKRENYNILLGVSQNRSLHRCIILESVSFQNQKTINWVLGTFLILYFFNLTLDEGEGFSASLLIGLVLGKFHIAWILLNNDIGFHGLLFSILGNDFFL